MENISSLKNIIIPAEITDRWQNIVNIMSVLLDVPVALIMKCIDEDIEVHISSEGEGNPYIPGEKRFLDNSGLYCEAVIKNKERLFVPNALNDEKWNKNPDLEFGFIFYLGFPIIMPNGEVFGTICVLDKVERYLNPTEEKLIIEFKKLAESQIEIVCKNYLLEVQKKELEELEEQKQIYIAAITHDLRSPLSATQKALEAILAKKLGDTLQDISEYLEDIYGSNKELLRLVNNLLSIYDFEKRGIELKLEETSIESLIGNSVRYLRHLSEESRSNITLNIEPNLPLVMVDKGEIYRVISNLISNAQKHNPKGININISAKKINEKVLVSVKDNGLGIPEAEKKNIFQKYPSTKREVGTGLGLYLCKQIIEFHKENIGFETEENKGTTFFFSLPVKNSN